MSGSGLASRPYSAAGSQGLAVSSPAGISVMPFPPPLFHEAAQNNADRPFNSVTRDPNMTIHQSMGRPKFASEIPFLQDPGGEEFKRNLNFFTPVAYYADDAGRWVDPQQVRFTLAPNVADGGEWSPRNDSEASSDSDSSMNDTEDYGPKSHPYYSQAPPASPTARYHASYFDAFGNEPVSFQVEGNGREVVQGFQVIKLAMGSPAQKAGILPFFDYLVAADDVPLTDDVAELAQRLASKRGEGVLISVFNARQRAVRQVAVYPDDHWGDGGLFGCTIVWNQVQTGYPSARKVTMVDEQNGSDPPLLPTDHFIIGMEEFPSDARKRICCFSTPDEFEYWAEQHRGSSGPDQSATETPVLEPIQLLVFDVKENTIFRTRVPSLAHIRVAAPLQFTIPFADELPLFPEGGRVARAMQKTGKKLAKKEPTVWSPSSPGRAQDASSQREPHRNPLGAGEAGGLAEHRKADLYHGVLMKASFSTMLVLLALFVVWCLAVGIYAIVVFALTLKRGNNPNLSIWLIVYGLRTVLILPCCATFFMLLHNGRLRRQDPVVELWRLFALLGVVFALAWLVLGTVWVFSQPSLRNNWSLLYWSCLAVVITEYVHHSVWVCSHFFQAFDEMDKADASVEEMLARMVDRPPQDEFDIIP
eukprot:GGOE01002427.1.p1 GENE.GGOE01002427.1~~GGOE01002427.1.p1  ORF type:complete len:681 (-),score=157.70 GGOE01002427.1:197-2134(-)